MARQHDDFIGALRARDLAEDVLALNGLYGEVEVCVEGEAIQGEGFEVRQAGGGAQGIEVLSGGGEPLAGHIAVQPALKVDRLFCRCAAGDGVILTGGRGGDVPAIAGRFGLMDDEGGNRASAGSFLELVGPAAVIGHALATKEACGRVIVCNAEVGVIDEEEGDFSGEVGVAIIVPAALGCAGAKADKDDGGVLDADIWAGIGRADLDIAALLEINHRAVCACDVEGVHIGDNRMVERDGVCPGAVAPARLQPDRLELVDEVGDGSGLAFGAGGAAFKFVRSHDADDLGHVGGADLCRGGLQRGCGVARAVCAGGEHEP